MWLKFPKLSRLNNNNRNKKQDNRNSITLTNCIKLFPQIVISRGNTSKAIMLCQKEIINLEN